MERQVFEVVADDLNFAILTFQSLLISFSFGTGFQPISLQAVQ
jgi:hypothetical protein